MMPNGFARKWIARMEVKCSKGCEDLLRADLITNHEKTCTGIKIEKQDQEESKIELPSAWDDYKA